VDADFNPLLRKRLEIIGTVMRTRQHEERVALVREFTERMVPLFAQGRVGSRPALRPVLERAVPMERLAEAHAAMERNETFGKLVGTWSAEPLRRR
jgi:NADPH:quinone reductase-like Zn-dependent oxidoreductase